MPNREFLVVRLRQFGDEAGGTLEAAGVTAGHAEEWKREIQFILGASDRDVK